MYSLVYDFGFEVKRYVGYTTADIFPPTHNAFVVVWNVLENYLVQDGSFNGQIDCIHQYYIEGWSKQKNIFVNDIKGISGQRQYTDYFCVYQWKGCKYVYIENKNKKLQIAYRC